MKFDFNRFMGSVMLAFGSVVWSIAYYEYNHNGSQNILWQAVIWVLLGALLISYKKLDDGT